MDPRVGVRDLACMVEDLDGSGFIIIAIFFVYRLVFFCDMFCICFICFYDFNCFYVFTLVYMPCPTCIGLCCIGYCVSSN